MLLKPPTLGPRPIEIRFELALGFKLAGAEFEQSGKFKIWLGYGCYLIGKILTLQLWIRHHEPLHEEMWSWDLRISSG